MSFLAKAIGLAAALAATLWTANFFYQHHKFVITDNAFQMADITDVSTQDVSGKIVKLYKKEYESVKGGEPLFKVDASTLEKSAASLRLLIASMESKREALKISLERLRGELPSAAGAAERGYLASLKKVKALERELEASKIKYETSRKTAQAKLKAAEAARVAAEEEFKRLEKKFERYSRLYSRRVISKEQLEGVRAAYFAARARLSDAEATLKEAREKLRETEALKERIEALKEKLKAAREESLALKEKWKASKSRLKQIEEVEESLRELEKLIEAKRKELERTEILISHSLVRSPVDGFVAKRWREEGEFVSPGLPVYSIYSPQSFYILAWIDEDKIGKVKVGAEARVELETCNREYEARVYSVGSSAGSLFALIPRDTSTGEYTRTTQRIPVKLKIERKLPLECVKPGANATVYIRAGR